MIVFDRVSVLSRVGWKTRPVILNVSLEIPSNRRIALVGGLPEDRVTVLNLIGGALLPSAGRIMRNARISFPTSLNGAFDGTISLRRNIEFVASIYGVDPRELVAFVKRLVDFGSDFDKPYRALPRDIRKQLGQIITFGLPFDLYVVNGLFNGGPKPLRDAASELYTLRSKTCGIILNSRDIRTANKQCEMALVLREHSLLLFDAVQDATPYVDTI